MDQVETLAEAFLLSLRQGRVCLHPTDTLPGLTFDPEKVEGRAAVAALKGRVDVSKPFLGLVASLSKAQRHFAPLPEGWMRILAELWPGPLSVVWQASPLAPKSLVAEDGTIGLRVPDLAADAAWFRLVLEKLEGPLPTTSVNRAGEPPMTHFGDAGRLLAETGSAHVPAWLPPASLIATSEPDQPAPSTVIRLTANGGYVLLRQGAMAKSLLDACVDEAAGTLH